jgi:F-type H+-transporting ATPase subunit epsilon
MQLLVVTPLGFSVGKMVGDEARGEEVDEVTAPGVRGEFGVLPGHTPFLSALKAGVLFFRSSSKRTTYAVGPGYAEVSGRDRVVILTQTCVAASDVDMQKARQQLDESERQLKDWKGSDSERQAVEATRDWAQAQLAAKPSS